MIASLTLDDVAFIETNERLPSQRIGSLMRGDHRNHGVRLRDYVWRGRRCISVENEIVRAVFCADKGADLIELTHKPSDTEVLAQSPRGLAWPADLSSSPLPGGPFRDVFPGGWYVMLPNGPGPCEHRGASYGHHGEATFLAFEVDVIEDSVERVEIAFSTRLRRTPIAFERRVALARGSGVLTMTETVISSAPCDLEILWGHHPTFGGPFLEEARVHLPEARARTGEAQPGARIAPHQDGPWRSLRGTDGAPFDVTAGPRMDEGAQDFVLLTDLAAPWFALTNDRLGVGVAVRWEDDLFPVLGLWRVAGGVHDYPWWGRSCMLALEPACDLPSLAEAAARGTAVRLAPGKPRTTRIEATLFSPKMATVVAVDPGGDIR